ncbi:MAG: hypothetical protein AAFX39_02405, partial [Pseudomonadota bacterium]
MAALVLTAAASAGSSVLGLGPVGSALLKAGAGLAGGLVDQALFSSSSNREREGPRLDTLAVSTSTEGAPIPKVYGRARIGGQVIWATEIEEVSSTETETVGGKGSPGSTVTTTSYTYYANLAIGLCEGPIHQVLRIWADGRELDLTEITYRVHRGTSGQEPDSLVEAKEGAGNAPAYRGTAYIVFERLD